MRKIIIFMAVVVALVIVMVLTMSRQATAPDEVSMSAAPLNQ